MNIIKPMLAHKYNPERAIYPAYIQPKLDGVRCLITKDGAYSRTGKEFKNVEHIKVLLKGFFKDFREVVLDGELYNHELKDDFEKIISLVRKTKPTEEHKYEAAKLIQFHYYDILTPNHHNKWPYSKRKDFLREFVPQGHTVQLVPTAYILNDRDAGLHHKANLKIGYEGSILRSLDGVYKGTRSWDLMKFKDFSDAEATAKYNQDMEDITKSQEYVDPADLHPIKAHFLSLKEDYQDEAKFLSKNRTVYY